MKLIGNNHSKHSAHGAHAAPKHAAERGKQAESLPKTEENLEETRVLPTGEVAAAAAAAAKTPIKESKAAKPGMKKGLKAAMVSLAVVVVVVLGVVIGYSMWEAPPPIAGPSELVATPSPTPTPTPTPTPSGDDPEDPEPSQEPVETPPVDEFEGALMTERDDGIYTFLLVGRDAASNSTDTIIVGKFDTNKHTIDMVNIPRDTLINIGWCTTPKKINAVYPGFENNGKSGIDGLRTQVKNFIGFDVDFYAVVNINVVEKVIDAIGGVDFDVPINMDYDDGSQNFHVHLKKGYQHLNGYEALGVFRFRTGGYVGGVLTPGYPGGDVQRIQTQQSLLMAIASQMLSLGNIPNLTTIIDLCIQNVETTLNASNMAFFARQFLKCSMDDINFHEMPIATSSIINGVSYVAVAPNSWIELINERLNPYSQDVTTANVSILTANENGSWIESTTGYIEGSWESFYCQSCSYKNNWKATWHTPGACPVNDPVAEDDPFAGTTTEPGTGDAPVEDTPTVEPSLPPVTDDPFAGGGDTGAEAPPAETPVE